jgi:hypothetical protein
MHFSATNITSHRFSFNGHEKDDELKGPSNHISFGDYGYDPRLGRRWQLDPKASKYPHYSPYSAFESNPILNVDVDGKEPRWGQLANLSRIQGEMAKVYRSTDIVKMSLSGRLDAMQAHFEANRTFKYDAKSGGFKETSSEASNVGRYIYTEKVGWIDMNHFFGMASVAAKSSPALAKEYSYESENIQGAYNSSESSYSYEDLPSDFAGIDFIKQYGSDLKNGKVSLMDAVSNYLTSLGATDPSKAPNSDYIPYFADDKAPKNMSPVGLTGNELKEAGKASFERKSNKVQDQINKAHEQISNE